MTLKILKERISKEEHLLRLKEYTDQLELNSKSIPLQVQGLHLKATLKYLLLSKGSLYECPQVEVLGFNKLNCDWQFDPRTNTLSHLAIPQSYRDFTDRRETDTYPISLSVNGVDGISQGLYTVVTKCIFSNCTRNYLLWINDGKSRLIDLRNNCSFQIYKMK